MRGTEQRFDHRHVANCIFKWIGNFRVLPDRHGEKISLNRELVTDGQSFDDRATSRIEILAVVDQNAARLVGRAH